MKNRQTDYEGKSGSYGCGARPLARGSRPGRIRIQEAGGTAVHRGRARQGHHLFGGMTWKHEEMFRAVFQGSGYRCENIPAPDVLASRSARNSATTASAIRRISPLVISSNTCKDSKNRACRGRRLSTTMCSSPPDPAARAVSACTKPSIASRWRMPASAASACFSSSRTTASRPPPASRAQVHGGLRHGHAQCDECRRRLNEIVYQIRPFEVNQERPTAHSGSRQDAHPHAARPHV